MGIHQLYFSCKLPIDIEIAWKFFSDPKNLSKITPPGMNFRIRSKIEKEETYEGQMIALKVSPLLGIPMTWLTEITHVKAPHYFVDEQRKGPYRIWHHEHEFIAIHGGIEMIDRLTYEVPFGPFGEILNSLFIESKILDIFAHRKMVLEKMFGNFNK